MSAAEAQIDLDRITHPLRLAQGSHRPGSGKGCAMNAISYINGDTRITDFPTGSARPLAILVQSCNDLLAGPGGYLSPENSLLALELAWQTVGTADVADTVVHAWLAELLANPIWGVVKYAKITAVKSILDIAELHRNAASGDMPSIAAWDAADCAAARAISPTSNRAGTFAIRAAYESTAVVNCQHYQATLDVVTAFAVRPTPGPPPTPQPAAQWNWPNTRSAHGVISLGWTTPPTKRHRSTIRAKWFRGRACSYAVKATTTIARRSRTSVLSHL